MSMIAGYRMPRRMPRRPSIGFCSRMRATACSRRSFSASSVWIVAANAKLCDLGDEFVVRRQELVQRRIDQANDHREPVHGARARRGSPPSGWEAAWLRASRYVAHRLVRRRRALASCRQALLQLRVVATCSVGLCLQLPRARSRCALLRRRRESSCARSAGAPPRRTCARCGRGRCPGRRTHVPARRLAGSRHLPRPPAA